MLRPPYESKNPIFGYLLFVVILAILIPVSIRSGWWAQPPVPRWALVLSVGWVLAWLVFLVIYIRRVQAYPDRLVVKTMQGYQDIDYRDVEWLFELTNRRGPSYTFVKYFDSNRLTSRILMFIPAYYSGPQDSPMTEYIRNQVIRLKQAYRKEAEPSPTKIYALFMLVMAATFVLAWLVDSVLGGQ